MLQAEAIQNCRQAGDGVQVVVQLVQNVGCDQFSPAAFAAGKLDQAGQRCCGIDHARAEHIGKALDLLVRVLQRRPLPAGHHGLLSGYFARTVFRSWSTLCCAASKAFSSSINATDSAAPSGTV